MFKTNYAAVCDRIAPSDAICEQVLAAMHAEEAAQLPTIVPIKKAAINRRLWMPLVACAAVALIAVTLGLTLRDSDPLPVAPAPSTASTTEASTFTTEDGHSTTITNEAVVPTTDTASGTSGGDTSTTPTTTAADTAEETTAATNTSGTSPTPTTTAHTTEGTTAATNANGTSPTLSSSPAAVALKSPADYNELFQLMQPFTSAPSSGSTTYVHPVETTSTTASPPTVSPTTTQIKPIKTTDPMSTAPSATTAVPSTTSAVLCPETTTSPFPTRPQCGAVVTDTDTTPPLQVTDNAVGRLEGNTVSLAPADKANASWTSTVTPTLPSDMYVDDFCLYGDRLVLICRPELFNAPSPTVLLLVYELKGTSPSLVGTFGQDGAYLAAHRAQDVLYIVSYYTPSGSIDSADPVTYVPCVYDNGTATALSAQQIAVANHPVGNAYTVVTALSLSGSDTRLSATALYGQSNSRLWISGTDMLISSVPYTSEGLLVSDVVNIPLTKTALFPCATATLPGQIDLAHVTPEYYYVLTTNQNTDSAHGVFILDRQMNSVGRLEGVLKGEGRFVFTKTALYALNSRYRHTVDLRVPTAPRLLATVETDWSIECLAEIGNNRLLIGYTDQNVNTPMTLAIVDTDWNILQQVSTRSGWILGEPRDGLLILRDEIFSYDEMHGIQKQADVNFGSYYAYPTLSSRTLYFLENDNVVCYDRTNNYRCIGKL